MVESAAGQPQKPDLYPHRVDVVLIAAGERHAKMALPCIKSIISHSTTRVRLFIFGNPSSQALGQVKTALKEKRCASITIIDVEPMYEEMRQIAKDARFVTTHYSGIHALQKLLVDKHLPKNHNIEDFIFLDTDMVLTRDIAEMAYTATLAMNMQHGAAFAMPCYKDPSRTQQYCTSKGRQKNCHKSHYCTSGPFAGRMSNLAKSNFSASIVPTQMRNMFTEDNTYRSSVADQDVYNRVAGTMPELMSVIPQRWACHSHQGAAYTGPCHLFHFIGNAQSTWNPHQWDKYANMDMAEAVRAMKCN